MIRGQSSPTGEKSSLEDLAELPAHLLTITEVATYLRIGRSTAYRLCQKGLIPTLTIGKAVRVPADALDEWVQRNVRTS